MPITNLGELKTSIQNWMFDRQDLAAVAGDFVDLCHADINATLRLRQQLKVVDLPLGASGQASLPDDFMAWRNVTALNNPRVVLEFVAPTFQDWDTPFGFSGIPRTFTISGQSLVVRPVATGDIRLEYWAVIPPLVDDADTNWLLTDHPDVYLYGSLHHACLYIGNDNRAGIMASKQAAIIQALIDADRASMYSRTAARISRVVP